MLRVYCDASPCASSSCAFQVVTVRVESHAVRVRKPSMNCLRSLRLRTALCERFAYDSLVLTYIVNSVVGNLLTDICEVLDLILFCAHISFELCIFTVHVHHCVVPRLAWPRVCTSLFAYFFQTFACPCLAWRKVPQATSTQATCVRFARGAIARQATQKSYRSQPVNYG